ncbi:FAD-dependent oxidoreductase [Patescibacteria group bacterium]|nr:FAD-dependent oxidoreductase [Patescibacteria group bacterium]
MIKKKIAIIGAGFTGLAAGFRLLQIGHEVTVFEKRDRPGGMSGGFREKAWEWTLEEYYHHWFTNDIHILGLAAEIGYKTIMCKPVTSVYVEDQLYQFDSPQSILRFPKLSLFDKLRMAAAIGVIRYDPFWKPLEGINAGSFLPKVMGKKAYRLIWEPQFTNKFGKYSDEVSLAWFWARIRKRTQSLVYPVGGFLQFANALIEKIIKLGGNVFFNMEVTSVKEDNGVFLRVSERKKENIRKFDSAIITIPSTGFLEIAPQLSQNYKNSLGRLNSLGATNLVLRLNKQFFPDKTYWLSICDSAAGIMAIVEHTNFMDKRHYNNEHIVYVGNYTTSDHPKFLASKEKLLSTYDPFLRKINSAYKNNLIDYKLFKTPFAQPIIPPYYSKLIPSIATPLPNIYLANMQQVYPWDRGTNYAVELGEKTASMVHEYTKI